MKPGLRDKDLLANATVELHGDENTWRLDIQER
jgi:hypothetical protein